MSIRWKLVLIIFVVSVLPLVVLGLRSIQIGEKELSEKNGVFLSKSSYFLAQKIDDDLVYLKQNLKLSLSSMNLSEIEPDRIYATVKSEYVKANRINILTLLDDEKNDFIKPLYKNSQFTADPDYILHEPVMYAEYKQFVRTIPDLILGFKKSTQENDIQHEFSDIFSSYKKPFPLLMYVFRFENPLFKEEVVKTKTYIHAAAEISLNFIQDLLKHYQPGEHGSVFIVNKQGELLFHDNKEYVASKTKEFSKGELPLKFHLKDTNYGTYTNAYEIPMVGGTTRLKSFDAWAVVAEPVEDAYRSSQIMKTQIGFALGLSLAFSVIIGLLFSTRIIAPLKRLALVAQRMAQGKFDLSIDLKKFSNDEFGQLAKSFGLLRTRSRLFFQYVDKNIVERVVADEKQAQLGGTMKQTTIIFGDMRQYTAMSNKLEPEQVVRLVNTYYFLFIDIVDKFGGIVDKIMGDAIMVFFDHGAVKNDFTYFDNARKKAVKAAVYMKLSSQILSQIITNSPPYSRLSQLIPKEFGFGIASGVTIVGNIGSYQFSNYTVCGRVANLASRLQSITKHGEIVLDKFTAKASESAIELISLTPFHFKGFEIDGEIVPFQIVRPKNEFIDEMKEFMYELFCNRFINLYVLKILDTPENGVNTQEKIQAITTSLQNLARMAVDHTLEAVINGNLWKAEQTSA